MSFENIIGRTHFQCDIWNKVCKSGLSKFFKVCLPQIFEKIKNWFLKMGG